MIVQFFNRFTRTTARPIVMMVVIAALVLSTVSVAFAVADANVNQAPVAAALPVLPASTQFDITGFLQSATLDQACVAAAGASLDAQGNPKVAHCGGTMILNGHTIVVPNETVVILPASALTWQELFAQSPAPYTGVATGMALNDLPKPLTTYEFQAVGNRVGNTYIAGLVHVSQQDLNAGAGYINFMDYALGEFRIGGNFPDPNCVQSVANTVAGGPNCSGARVKINDPIASGTLIPNTGRYTRGTISPDGRFQVDQDNPTIASATGYPMCFPRVTADPNIAGNVDDPLCPLSNRPISSGANDDLGAHPPAGEFDSLFRMVDPATIPLGGSKDPRIQAPFEVGDYVNFAGTLIADAGGTYISAHTMINNVAIFTAPGTNPAYVSIEVGLIGTGGLTVFGAGEAAIRTKFEGMTTDETRGIHLYGIDINPVDGSTTDRDWGTILPDPGPPNGAVRGRWRFRPPCTVAIATDKKCTPPVGGSFLPPTREVRAVIEGLQQFLPGTQIPNPVSQVPGTGTEIATANGIFYGQYHAPIGEFIFPENIPGNPIVENNFNTIEFLTKGGYTSFSGVVVCQLNPWPSNIVPPASTCGTIAPVANAGPDQTVAAGTLVTLDGSATTGSPAPALSWAQTAGPVVALSGANTAHPTFTAPTVAGGTTLTFTLTAGASTDSVTITVSAAQAPTVAPIANQAIDSGSSSTFTVTGSDPNVPTATPLTFTVANDPTNTVTLTGLTASQNGTTGANIHYTAPSGVLSTTVVNLLITATNSAGVASAPATAQITINPVVVACVAPVANAGGPYTVNSGGTVTLAGNATGTTPLTFAWAVPASGSVSPLSASNATYTAANSAVDQTVNLSLTVTNGCGTSTATSSVLVKAAMAPVINAVSGVTIFSGANGALNNVTGSDPNLPAPGLLPLTWTIAQNPANTLSNLVITSTGTATANITFSAPILPATQVTNTVVTLTITAKNSANVSSSVNTTVTVKPLPDTITITNAEYRTGKQRLIITITSSNPNATWTLQPYACASAQPAGVPPCPNGIFDPTGLGNTFSLVNGVLSLTLVGAPEPAIPPATPLVVISNIGGTSPAHGLDRIRQ